MTYTTSTTKTKAAQYDLPGINRLTNLSGDDVADFAIALRMFTRRPGISEKGTLYSIQKTHKDYYVKRLQEEQVMRSEEMDNGDIGKEKSPFHDQGHQQAAKGKEDDEEFGEICWRRIENNADGVELTLETNQQGGVMKYRYALKKHAEYDESNTYVLERFNTTAGNPVKKILLKLNLSDHRSILTDSKVTPTKLMGRMTKLIHSPCFMLSVLFRIFKDSDGGTYIPAVSLDS
ncbi:hypothetical protein Tco_1093811 [Tanacetum coccineum]|uniref:Uncharacterized protein n=1 Tax=Tanacetum coccineum TaxID=301880 RepID=A0ABQ5IDU5_9ASTR